MNRRILILFTEVAKTSASCVVFHFLPQSSVTSLQVPTTHSEEINLKAKKGGWTATPLARKMINVDETGEPFLGIQTVPSVCLSVSLAGNGAPMYTKEVFCLVRRVTRRSLFNCDQRWHLHLA